MRSFCIAKATPIFSAKSSHYFTYNIRKFHVLLVLKNSVLAVIKEFPFQFG